MNETNHAADSNQGIASDVEVVAEVAAEGPPQDEEIAGQLIIVEQHRRDQPTIGAPILVEATDGSLMGQSNDRFVNRTSIVTASSMNTMLRQLQGQPPQEQHRVAEHLPAAHENRHPIRNRARFHRKQQKQQAHGHQSSSHLAQRHSERRQAQHEPHSHHNIASIRNIGQPTSLERRREEWAIRRAAHNVQREFAQQVSHQLEALENTFREAVQRIDPERHDDDVETNVRNNQRHGASTNQLSQGSPPYLGSSIACRTRTISGYDGDNEDDDASDGGSETAKRHRSK